MMDFADTVVIDCNIDTSAKHNILILFYLQYTLLDYSILINCNQGLTEVVQLNCRQSILTLVFDKCIQNFDKQGRL